MPLYGPATQIPHTVSDMLRGASTSSPAIMSHRAHRHAFPENSMAGYESSFAVADAAEISFYRTADYVPICMHDSTLTRTTDGTGNISDITYATLKKNVKIDIGASTLGAGWASQDIPLLMDVIDLGVGKIPLLVEPKTGSTSDFGVLYDIINRFTSPTSNFIIKGYRDTDGTSTSGVAAAAGLGYTTWVYYSEADTADMITAGANDPYISILSIPASLASEANIALASATGKPVTVHDVNRRSEMATFTGRGATMIMSPQVGYLQRSTAALTSTHFADQLRDPGMIRYNLAFETFPSMDAVDGSIAMTSGTTNTLMLGSLCGTTAPASYVINFSIKWPTLPAVNEQSGIAFGKPDDSSFGTQDATNASGGYHLVIRPRGATDTDCAFQLYTHAPLTAVGTKIGELASSAKVVADTWLTGTVTVTAANITIERTDVATDPVTVANTTYRGPYVHLVPGSSTQTVEFGNVSIT